ncbi:MAG: heavy-metal-associated domain-containing protein [Gemmatimonadales bacterium]
MCAHAVRVAVKKIEGVEAVEVSLNRGVAVIRFRPDNRATIGQVRRAIRTNGFTPKAAEVRIAGTVVEREGRLALEVPGSDSAYVMQEAAESQGAVTQLRAVAGRPAIIEGSVPETGRRGDGPWTLEVWRFSLP